MSETTPPEHHDDTLPKGAEMLTGHNYDGIQEYDNPTPAWWTWIFVASVVFGVIYMFFVLAAGDELSPHGQYRRARIANTEKQIGELGELTYDAETIRKYMDDERWMAYAGNIFKNVCATCHGAGGEGGAGPNLTDDAYIHIQKLEDIARVIREGEANGNMPAQEAQMEPTQIVLLASYVAALRGENRSGKPAEGEIIPPWEMAAEGE